MSNVSFKGLSKPWTMCRAQTAAKETGIDRGLRRWARLADNSCSVYCEAGKACSCCRVQNSKNWFVEHCWSVEWRLPSRAGNRN